MPLVPPYVASLTPYVPGKPIEEVEREYQVTDVAKLASNENALGPSPRALAAAREAAAKVNLYPDGAAFVLRNAIAAKLGVPPAEVMVGSGSNELIELLVRTFVLDVVKTWALAATLGGGLVALLLWIMDATGRYWWLVGWLAWASVSVVLTMAWPRFIAPLFNRFSPLDDAALRGRIEALLERPENRPFAAGVRLLPTPAELADVSSSAARAVLAAGEQPSYLAEESLAFCRATGCHLDPLRAADGRAVDRYAKRRRTLESS